MRFLPALLIASTAFADDVRRFEVSLAGSADTNRGLTQHVGAGAGFAWNLHPRVALRASGTWNAIAARESSLSDELVNARYDLTPSQTLLSVWNAMLSVEGIPLEGALHPLAHLGFVVFGGAGAVGTIHRLKPENGAGPATYGDTGVRPMGAVGVGARLVVSQRLVIRLDLRDLMFAGASRVVNGCNAADLAELNRRRNLDVKPDGPVGAGCSEDNFTSRNDLPLAATIANEPTNPVIHNVGVQLSFGFLF